MLQININRKRKLGPSSTFLKITSASVLPFIILSVLSTIRSKMSFSSDAFLKTIISKGKLRNEGVNSLS